MKSRDEKTILRRRQSGLDDTPDHVNNPQSEGAVTYIGKVVRDDRFWPCMHVGLIVFGGATHAPAPPYVAMTRPLRVSDSGALSYDDTDPLVPVLSINEAPIDGTQVIAFNAGGQWITDDAFGGYFRVKMLGYCSDVNVSGANVTVQNLSSPGESQTAVWGVGDGGFHLSAVWFDPPATGGTFTVTSASTGGPFGSGPPFWTTAPIAFNATAADVQAALLAAGYTMTCLDGPLPGKAILVKMTTEVAVKTDPSGLTGGHNPIMRIAVGPYVRGGTYRIGRIGRNIGAGGQWTENIPWDATLEQFQDIFEHASWIGRGNVIVTDVVPGLAYGKYLCEFINERKAPFNFGPALWTVDFENLIGPDGLLGPGHEWDDNPLITLSNVQAGQAIISTNSGTAPGLIDPGALIYGFEGPSTVMIFPYRTRGPFKFTVIGSFTTFEKTVLPPAGLDQELFSVGYIPGKVCTCFGQLNPTLTVSTPFGDVTLGPSYDAFGRLIEQFVFDGALTVDGYPTSHIYYAIGPGGVWLPSYRWCYPLANSASSGATRIKISLWCGSSSFPAPSLAISCALIDGRRLPDGSYLGGFATVPCATASPGLTVDNLWPNCFAVGSYMGSSWPILPSSFPLSFSVSGCPGLAGTWTVNE